MRKWISVLSFAGVTAMAQQPPATFRAGTQLVQVSIVAQDKQGKPVADLRREDFQSFDNGAAQEIRLFVAETERSISSPPELKRSGTFTNQIASSAGSRSGYSVILFDNLVTGFGKPGFDGTSYGAQMVLRTLRAMPEGEKIALYAIGWKLQIVREFTTDRESLEQQLRTWTPAVDTADLNYCTDSGLPERPAVPVGVPKSESPTGIPVIPGIAEANARALAECDRIDMARRLASFDEQLKQMADHLAGVPGRKNLIWMANRFPITGGPAVNRLMNAGVAIYPVDEAGVCRLCPPRPKQEMRALAELTGGVPYFSRNDIEVAVREAMDDGRVSYTLGFYRSGEDKQSTIHQLGVKVSRPGVTLRYRNSYETQAPQPISANPVADLVQAMNRPVDATAIPITASVKRVKDRLGLSVSIDVSTLDLELSDGLWKGKAEVVGRFITAEGVQAGEVISETVTFNLRPATYATMLKSGVPYRKEMKIPAKAVELKLLVANLATGKIGTLTVPLSEAEGGAANAK